MHKEEKGDEKGRNDGRGRNLARRFRGAINIMLGEKDGGAVSSAVSWINRIQNDLTYAFRFLGCFPPSLSDHLCKSF